MAELISRPHSVRLAVFASAICLCFARVEAADTPSFNRDIRPILSDKCFACHGPDQNHRQGDLRLDDRDAATRSAILPGNAKDSEVVLRILSTEEDKIMPPPDSKKTLSDREKKLLQQWIDAGAPYEAHWSLVPLPKSVSVPNPIDDKAWIKNEIDRFVLDQLDRQKLQHADEASRETWLRRVSFDLTGLPPTLDDIDAFLADTSDKAFEKVVDRLLQSSAYGERMAADWLDAARYADTFGYQSDREMHVWPWREWVINAFNKNLPYNDFLVWQLAGDMLPDATREQRLATAFNRLHRQTNEGGSIEQEFRTEYVADRVRTMGTAMLGLTFECARCHDHKYDPISQREYYSLQAIFNNIDEHGLYSHFTETAPTPTLLLYEGSQEAEHLRLKQSIATKETELASAEQQWIAKHADGSAVEAPSSSGTASHEIELPKAAYTQSFNETKASGDYQVVDGREGKAIQFGGDDQLTLKEAPQLSRAEPFTISLWVNPSEHAARMIVAHQSRAAEDSAFRGFSLVLDQGTPVVSLIHFWPGNAIAIKGKRAIELNAWTNLCITYDGSSHASGLRLYVQGQLEPTDVVRDKLTRDFTHRSDWGDSDVKNVHFALGARFRDVGFRNGKVDELSIFAEELSALEVRKIAAASTPLTPTLVASHAALRKSDELQKLRAELRELRKSENELVSKVRQIMTMEEMLSQRPTFVLARGAYDAPGAAVGPSVPRALHLKGDELPSNRLEFARWLVEPSHPLTSRVAVNRIWRIFFGQGLVTSVEDFGNQGDVPSHPELLDWLARRFVDSGWNTKELCKLIVLSATYRQNSKPADESYFTRDPQNRWLGRGPRHRLNAEQVRDSALAASGLLVRKIGGPSVYPYQPAGVWEESGTGKSYHQSKGDDLYRRSLYSFWRRTSPPPSMTTFDAPSREFCMVRRERTATPMQALTLLNDPQFVEAARKIAEQVLDKNLFDNAAAITMAFRILTSRKPSATEVDLCAKLLEDQTSYFVQNAEKAKQFIAIGESQPNTNLEPARVAAMMTVVQLIMSFDESVTKR